MPETTSDRAVTTAELNALPEGSVIIGPAWNDESYQKGGSGLWWEPGSEVPWTARSISSRGPYVVLHRGDAEIRPTTSSPVSSGCEDRDPHQRGQADAAAPPLRGRSAPMGVAGRWATGVRLLREAAMTAHDTPRTDERAGLSDTETAALVADARSHRRHSGARYCESCVEGVERLADALAAAVARAEAAEAKVAAVEALRDEWDDEAMLAWANADRASAGDVIADQITRRAERLRMTLADVPTSAPTGEAS